LLSALLLQVFYGIRSERQLMEQFDDNLLYRWFVGLAPDDPVWDATTFTKNRERLQRGDVFQKFLGRLGRLSGSDFRWRSCHYPSLVGRRRRRRRRNGRQATAAPRRGRRVFRAQEPRLVGMEACATAVTLPAKPEISTVSPEAQTAASCFRSATYPFRRLTC